MVDWLQQHRWMTLHRTADASKPLPSTGATHPRRCGATTCWLCGPRAPTQVRLRGLGGLLPRQWLQWFVRSP